MSESNSNPSHPKPRRTPLYANHQAAGARFVDFFGWEMPLQYEGQLKEHEAVRTSVGMFDVSHMGQVRISGPDSLSFLNWLMPADFSALEIGSAKYTMLCNDEGCVIDDLIVSRVGESEYFAVINASRIEVDVDWMTQKLEQHGGELTLVNESDLWAMIAVQGPASLDRLVALGILPGDGALSKPFTIGAFQQDHKTWLISRTGYTGEVGVELLCPAAQAGEWWDMLMADGIVPCGLASRDSLRLEAGYCLYGQDLTTDTTPIEAGLGWTVGWKKECDYVGRRVIEFQKGDGVEKQLCGFVSESKRPIRPKDKIFFNDQEIGVVTSGGYSPELKCGIAMGYVFARPKTRSNDGWAIESRGTMIPVKLESPPFVSTSLRKK